MAQWIRFEADGKVGFGTLQEDRIAVHRGDMYTDAEPTGETLALGAVQVLPPSQPSKIVALWNNFEALRAKLDLEVPPEPLYFIKSNNSILDPGGTIRPPASYSGKVIFEGELGVIIGRRATAVSEAEAASYIFGYTCVNDVTAFEIIFRDASFQQWVRAKSFDTFGPFGPVVATGLDPQSLSIRTIVNGDERQNYPVSDMIVPPQRLVSRISQDITLEPGDLICCGTSVGAGSLKPGAVVEVSIEGIGTLMNRYGA